MIDTDSVIERVSAQHSTFTLSDLTRAVAEPAQVAGGGIDRIPETVQAITADERLVKLNEHRYTTRATLDLERGALDRAKRLAEDASYHVEPGATAAAIRNRPLFSEEQRVALDHLTGPARLSNLEGLAGIGKSHLLAAAREAWEAHCESTTLFGLPKLLNSPRRS